MNISNDVLNKINAFARKVSVENYEDVAQDAVVLMLENEELTPEQAVFIAKKSFAHEENKHQYNRVFPKVYENGKTNEENLFEDRIDDGEHKRRIDFKQETFDTIGKMKRVDYLCQMLCSAKNFINIHAVKRKSGKIYYSKQIGAVCSKNRIKLLLRPSLNVFAKDNEKQQIRSDLTYLRSRINGKIR